MMLTCMYCGTKSMNYEMFVVRQAVKPPRTHNRWVKIGLCCDVCYEVKPVQIDKWRST